MARTPFAAPRRSLRDGAAAIVPTLMSIRQRIPFKYSDESTDDDHILDEQGMFPAHSE